MLGYGWAGLFRKFLVDSPFMWWPTNLVQVSLFRSLLFSLSLPHTRACAHIKRHSPSSAFLKGNNKTHSLTMSMNSVEHEQNSLALVYIESTNLPGFVCGVPYFFSYGTYTFNSRKLLWSES